MLVDGMVKRESQLLMAAVVSVTDGLFEQLDRGNFDHMFGKIETELKTKCTDKNGIIE